MREIVLGNTGIKVKQNGFGALPIQRANKEIAKKILRKAYDGGIKFFDTARAYSDSEEKLGLSLADVRKNIYIATKTLAKTPEDFWEHLNKSLELLKTDYIDIYQFHGANQMFMPGDGTGMYECMLEAKEKGLIKHIGITTHKIQVAFDAVESGLYETLQFPFSYLASETEIKLVKLCKEKNVGFIAMKGLAGGLINNSRAAMAYMTQYDNVLPIWGIQKESELDEWLEFMDNTPIMDAEMIAYIAREQKELSGEFCRGCGYCLPCPVGIKINQCARISLMIRRAPSAYWLSEEMQKEMSKIDDCINCRKCVSKCPYSLNTPDLLRKNLDDYRKVVSGEISVAYTE